MPDLTDLLARAEGRTPITSAGKSGATLERLRIDGEHYVLKQLDLRVDWTMRAAGALTGATAVLWAGGLLDRLPECIYSPIVVVEAGPVTRVLMRDVSPWLVPVREEAIEAETHARFVDHMAALHAQFWDAGAEVEVVPGMHRYLELSPWTAAAESEFTDPPLVPRLIGQGWPRLTEVAPAAARVVVPLALDPGPLVLALENTPQTFVHGNWKLDNLGTDPGGRTILLDWELPGRGPGLSDLAWYLAINCRRLPRSKEETIATYREALERRGVDTAGWWDRQLGLCLLGALVQFGWEKALGGYDDELVWWEQQALAGARFLG
jgi:Phosphotransferase enzyme family